MDREQEGVTRLAHLRLGGAHAGPREGAVVVEEPLEIRLDTRPIAVVMRTPGNDIELVLGFLVTEGIVSDPGVILQAAHCDETITDEEFAQLEQLLQAQPEARAFYRRYLNLDVSLSDFGRTEAPGWSGQEQDKMASKKKKEKEKPSAATATKETPPGSGRRRRGGDKPDPTAAAKGEKVENPFE